MSSIMTQMYLTDNMTAGLRNINNALGSVIGSMRSANGQFASGFDNSKLFSASQACDQMNAKLNEMEANINNNRSRQQQFNQTVNDGTGGMNRLLNSAKSVAGMYLGMQGVRSLFNISDQIASSTARLSLIVDDNGSVDELKNKIYASAQDSRAAYMNVMKDVSKMGILAGKAFNGNDELINFVNLANKSFVVGGASAQEQASAMYQLTQAMGSGRLQGDEYRSIIENAPLLAKSIEDYMVNVQKAQGSMKDWSSEGLLTAKVIKQAMINAADETNKRFATMPMTWAQVWTVTVNKIVQLSEPLLKFINVIAQHWDVLQPIIMGVAAAVLWYLAATHGVILAHTIGTAISGAYHGVIGLLSLGFGVLTGNTAAASAATLMFNSALYACPLTWILMLIIAIIAILYVVVAVINKVTGSSISATGIIVGVLAAAGAFIFNLGASVANFFIGAFIAVWNFLAGFANFFANFLRDPLGASAHLVASFCEVVLNLLSAVAQAIDTIFGSNLAGSINSWIGNLNSWADSVGNGKYKSEVKKINPSDYYINHASYSGAYNWGNKKGSNLFGGSGGAGSKMPGVPNLDNLANSAGKTADNTGRIADSVDISKEELKYLRDLAERETINRFTTASIKIEQTNNNNINSDLDVDGIIDKITAGTNEAVEQVAEGVHT